MYQKGYCIVIVSDCCILYRVAVYDSGVVSNEDPQCSVRGNSDTTEHFLRLQCYNFPGARIYSVSCMGEIMVYCGERSLFT